MRETILVKKNSGFTLMELMITIAIISILSAVSVPSVISWRENAQLGSVARDVYSDFQRAKFEAVKRNCWCSLDFTSVGCSVFVDSNRDRNLDAGETILSTTSWSDYGTAGPKANENTFIENPIAFGGDGLVKGGVLNGSIVLKDGRGNETSVIVSSAGNIRIRP